MARGGKRPGAGRKLGSTTVKTREIAERALEAGLSPLEYMLEVLRDANQPQEVRMDAAKAAAPYVHPKLAAVEHSGQIDSEITTAELTPTEVARAIAFGLQKGLQSKPTEH